MVIKVEPQTLFDLSAQALVNCLLDAWHNITVLSHLDPHHTAVVVCIDRIPHFILHKIFNLLFKSYINDYCFNICLIKEKARKHNKREIERLSPFCNLLVHILVPSLRVLDLSYLKVLSNVGVLSNEMVSRTEEALIKRLPFLNNLVQLNLKLDETMQHLINGDTILEKLGRYCPKLKSLDVSHNPFVSDRGVECLIPSEDHPGCPELSKLLIYECSVSTLGAAALIESLPYLKHLGYEGILYSLLKISRGVEIKTKLSYIALRYRVNCNHILTVANTCPNLKILKVIISDPYMVVLEECKEIRELDLLYISDEINMSSPGNVTELYLRHRGHKLISLSITCYSFTTRILKSICKNCPNLQHLFIKCDIFTTTNEDLSPDDCLADLKSFDFTVGCNTLNRPCNIPCTLFIYVLQHTHSLQKIVLRMKNKQINDKFMQILLKSIDISSLKTFVIYITNTNMMQSCIKLNMETVEFIIKVCPQLIKLGNIFEWDISVEEISDLTRRLKSSNSALDLLFIRDITIDMNSI